MEPDRFFYFISLVFDKQEGAAEDATGGDSDPRGGRKEPRFRHGPAFQVRLLPQLAIVVVVRCGGELYYSRW